MDVQRIELLKCALQYCDALCPICNPCPRTLSFLWRPRAGTRSTSRKGFLNEGLDRLEKHYIRYKVEKYIRCDATDACADIESSRSRRKLRLERADGGRNSGKIGVELKQKESRTKGIYTW